MEETKERKNAVEAYVSEMRNKVRAGGRCSHHIALSSSVAVESVCVRDAE